MTSSPSEPGRETFPLLFSPITLRGRQLKNRILHASMSTRYVQSGVVTEAFYNYHLSRARGGCAAIITEPMNIAALQKAPTRLSVHDGRAVGELKRLVDATTEHDCALIVQVQDRGRGRHEGGRIDQAYGASALPDGISWTVPHALTVETIREMIAQMAHSCANLAAIGFAGAELSSGHGHLIHQFLSPWSNRRDDEYGGDLEGRTRFMRELVAAIRDACPDDFLVGLKLPGEDGVKDSIDLDSAREIAGYAAEHCTPDFWSFAWGAHANSLYRHLPDAHQTAAPYAEATRTLRAAAPTIPTGALGYITDPHQAERQLGDGSAELVMLGRALVTDPHWPRKLLAGRDAEVRYCVSCNSCWRAIIEGNRIACDNNPRVGMVDEGEWKPTLRTKAAHHVIVGTGIAGLESAWILAEAGHKVTVFGAGEDPGGATRIHAALPGGENLSSIYDYQMLRLQKSDARVEFGVKADVAMLSALKPDSVILATGSTLATPDWLDEEWREGGLIPDLRTFAADFLLNPASSDGRLVVYDQDHTEMTYALAEHCAAYFSEVVIVTPRERIATDVALVTRQGIYQRLHDKRVRLVTCSEPIRDMALDEGLFEYQNVFNGDPGSIDDIAGITFATTRIPNDALATPLQVQGIAVRQIGDCYAPRTVMAATREGYEAAVALLGD